MITFDNAKKYLTSQQVEAIVRINRKVGPLKLYAVENDLIKILRRQNKLGNYSWNSEGYRSLYTPEMLDEPEKKFLAPKVFRPDKKRLTVAVGQVRKHLRGLGSVKPLALEEAYALVLQSKESHFAGLPTMGKKCDDVYALQRAQECQRGKCPPPVVCGHRGKNVEVARLIWMFPFEWHICEAAYFYPLQEKFKRNVRIYAAVDAVTRRARFNEIADSGLYQSKVAMDYSGFDASIGPQLIGIAFNLLSEHLEMSCMESRLWNRIATYFSTSPFIDQHMRLVTGRRGGVPSGSMFTQIIDSIVNAIVIEYVFAEVKQKKYFVLGDDSLTFLGSSLDEAQNLVQKAQALAGELGVTLNLKKTHVVAPGEVTLFLGHYDLVKGRPADDVLARLIFPERAFEPTAAALANRVVAYMAECDELGSVLYPLYEIYRALEETGFPRSAIDFDSFGRPDWEPPAVELGSINVRYLPGLGQYLAVEHPEILSSYVKIRAAL